MAYNPPPTTTHDRLVKLIDIAASREGADTRAYISLDELRRLVEGVDPYKLKVVAVSPKHVWSDAPKTVWSENDVRTE